MNKPETIAAAEAAGIIRTEKQFEALNKGQIEQLIKDYSAMNDEEKAAANEAAAAEANAGENNGGNGEDTDKKGKDKTKSEKAEKLQKDLAEVFKNYPDVKELFSTTDGTVFLGKNPAENHQLSLTKDKKEIETHKRK